MMKNINILQNFVYLLKRITSFYNVNKNFVSSVKRIDFSENSRYNVERYETDLKKIRIQLNIYERIFYFKRKIYYFEE